MNRKLRNESGSAFVELALVLPLLLLLLIGAVELGRVAYASIEVSNAARAAVAYGSQNPGTAGDNAGMTAAASADAADLTNMGATLNTTANDACVCNTGTGTPSVSCSNMVQQCCPPGETAHCTAGYYTGTGVVYVQATTTATLSTIFNYPGLPNSFTLNGFAQMRVIEN